MVRWMDKQTNGWKDYQMDSQMDIDRQTDRQIDRQTDRQTDRRTDRQTWFVLTVVGSQMQQLALGSHSQAPVVANN